jgi:hypothetical protein
MNDTGLYDKKKINIKLKKIIFYLYSLLLKKIKILFILLKSKQY